jgi:hypothetical protein
MSTRLEKDEKVLVTASGFTGLWAITWLGASMMGAGGAAQGAFGVGAVMSGSGLTALWWKTRELHQRFRDDAEAEDDSHVGRAHKG